MEELSTIDESQDEVELFGRLERELERYDERVVDFCQDSPLRQRMRDFRSSDDVGFPDGLQGVDPERVSLPNLHDLFPEIQSPISTEPNSSPLQDRTDLSEASLSDDLEQLERVDGQVLVLIGLEGHLHMNSTVARGQLQPLVHRLHRLQIRCEPHATQTEIRVPHIGVLIPLIGSSVGRDVSQVGCDADVGDTGHVAKSRQSVTTHQRY